MVNAEFTKRNKAVECILTSLEIDNIKDITLEQIDYLEDKWHFQLKKKKEYMEAFEKEFGSVKSYYTFICLLDDLRTIQFLRKPKKEKTVYANINNNEYKVTHYKHYGNCIIIIDDILPICITKRNVMANISLNSNNKFWYSYFNSSDGLYLNIEDGSYRNEIETKEKLISIVDNIPMVA